MSTELAVLPQKETAMTVYTADQGLDPYLAQIRTMVDVFKAAPPTLDTATGRAEYKSMSNKVAKMKTALEAMGKDLAAELKELPKKVDAERKRSWDYLESLQKEILLPVVEWDAEQERIKAQRAAEEAAKALALQIESDHEIALLLYADHLRKQAEALKIAEQAKRDADASIAQQAAAQATKEAEEKAAAAIRDAQFAEEKAKREKAEAEAAALKAQQDAAAAVIAAKAKADADAIAAVEAERLRTEQARLKAIADEEARAKNVAHAKKINNQILADIVQFAGCDEACAKNIITAIARKQIRHTSISY